MSTEKPFSEIAPIVLEALQQGDKNRGELLDLTGKGYSVLVQALQQLKDRNLIESYFVPSGNISILTYRLHSET